MEALYPTSETYPPIDAVEISQQPSEPHPMAVPLAGGLQAVYNNVVNRRNFSPDIHQDQAIQAIGKALVGGESSGYVEMATSTGKTLIESLLVEAAVRAGMRVLMLAPSKNIADQLYGQDGQTGLGRFTYLTHGKNIRRHYGGAKANSKASVVVATYAGLNAEAKKGKDGVLGDFDLIVGDECHWSLGPETSHNMRTYMPNAIKIGFSATPDFAADRTSEEIFGTPLFEFSLAEAVKEGVTAPVRAIVYQTATRLELWDSRNTFSEAELKPLIYDADRNNVAINVAKHLTRYRKQQGIIACVAGSENEHAVTLAEDLRDFGVAAEDVGAHLSRAEVKERLARFKSGVTKVLTFTTMLEEGWDSDRVNFCINLAPTSSPRRTKQLLGRLLRKKKDGSAGLYIDFADKKFGKQKTQYTACHALGYYNHDLTRVLGKPEGEGLLPLEELLPTDIFAHVKKSQDLLLEDMLKTKEMPVDTNRALIKEWEQRLESEGLHAEVSQHPYLTPAHERLLARHIAKFVRTSNKQGTSPDMDMASITADIRPHYLRDILVAAGIRVDYDDNLEEIEASRVASMDDILEEIAHERVTQDLHEMFDTLSKQEKGIVSLRFGVGSVALDRNGRPFPQKQAVIARSDGSWIDAETREVVQQKPHKQGAPVSLEKVKVRDIAMQVQTTYPAYKKPQPEPTVEKPDQTLGYDEISKVYGVTRERIRQIEQKTFRKMREPSRREPLAVAVEIDDTRSEIMPDPLQKKAALRGFTPEMSRVPLHTKDNPTPYENRLSEVISQEVAPASEFNSIAARKTRVSQISARLVDIENTIKRVQARPIANADQRRATMVALQQRYASLHRERDDHVRIIDIEASDTSAD